MIKSAIVSLPHFILFFHSRNKFDKVGRIRLKERRGEKIIKREGMGRVIMTDPPSPEANHLREKTRTTKVTSQNNEYCPARRHWSRHKPAEEVRVGGTESGFSEMREKEKRGRESSLG